MKAVLKDMDEKYYVMLMIGINSGIRVSDILKLKVKDVKDRDEIELKATKQTALHITVLAADIPLHGRQTMSLLHQQMSFRVFSHIFCDQTVFRPLLCR